MRKRREAKENANNAINDKQKGNKQRLSEDSLRKIVSRLDIIVKQQSFLNQD